MDKEWKAVPLALSQRGSGLFFLDVPILHNVLIRLLDIPEYASASIAPHLNRTHKLQKATRKHRVRSKYQCTPEQCWYQSTRPDTSMYSVKCLSALLPVSNSRLNVIIKHLLWYNFPRRVEIYKWGANFRCEVQQIWLLTQKLLPY